MKGSRVIIGSALKYTLCFLLALFFFILVRFPYGELKRWAISTLGERAGIEIEIADAGFLFPLGMEMKNVTLRREGENGFTLPGLENLALKAGPGIIFADEKTVRFRVVKGGSGGGTVRFTEGGATIKIESEGIEMDGLTYGSGVEIERGRFSLNGELTFRDSYLNGDGGVSVAARDILARGISPFIPELSMGSVNMTAEMREGEILLKSVAAEIEGIEIKGEGKVILSNNPMKSRIDLIADVDIGKGGGPLKEFMPLLKGIGGEGSRFRVVISGDLKKPKLSVNGMEVL